MTIRVLIEAFKIYKTLVCILGYNLLFKAVPVITTDDQGDFEIYRYVIVGLEVLSFMVMCLALHAVRMTIRVFGRNEFDLIRNNFTTDFYTKVLNTSGGEGGE